MKTEIYYFSGTGNSLWAAKTIARKTGGTLRPIASFLNQKTVSTDADIIGIVFPVYYEDLPVIVKNFALKLNVPDDKYIFAVCTFGGAAGWSLKNLKRVFVEKGGRLSAGFGIQMPQNAFFKRGEDRAKIYDRCCKRLDFILNKLGSQKQGMFYSNLLIEAVIFPLKPIIKSACKKQFMKLSGASALKTAEELLFLTDNSFSVSADCCKCGICTHVCPVQNIKMTDDGPIWLHHCETCLACYNWCPCHAIQGSISQKEFFYRHPEIKISEIISQHESTAD